MAAYRVLVVCVGNVCRSPLGERLLAARLGDGFEVTSAGVGALVGEPMDPEAAAHLERLTLEAFQSGLSWRTILDKRDNFRAAFAGFDADVVAAYDDRDVERLMADAGIVRNRRKVDAAITNARATVALRETGGLEELLWTHAPEPTPRPRGFADVPPQTAESELLAKRLRKAGFVQLGPTTVYAAMQACGLVDDHLVGCFRAGASRSGSRVTGGLRATS